MYLENAQYVVTLNCIDVLICLCMSPLLPQCTVKVGDQGYPEERFDTATLNLNVQREIELPSFGRPLYTSEISESAAVGTTLLRTQASLPVVVVCITQSKLAISLSSLNSQQLIDAS